MERIGFGPRFFAALIDFVIIALLVLLLSFLFFGNFSNVAKPDSFGYLGTILLTGLGLAYAFLEVLKGQTIGKMLLSLKIKNADGSEATKASLMKRWAVKYAGNLIGLVGAITTLSIFGGISMVVSFIIFAGYFMIFAADKLTLHDKLTNTSVFKTNQG